MKLGITGGHLTPALALIDYLQTQPDKIEIVFIGREYSQDSTQQKSQEQAEVESRGLPFVNWQAPKLNVTAWWKWPFQVVKTIGLLAMNVVKARELLRTHQITAVVSFGGYLAVPIALAAASLGVPILTHEQTRTTGFATSLIAFFATSVAVSYPESLKQLPAYKTTLTGNPLRAVLFQDQPQPSWVPSDWQHHSLPVIYITGGSQGSLALNQVVGEVLPELTKKALVIHQCGPASSLHNYHASLTLQAATLPAEQRGHYRVREWVSGAELSWVYRRAALVIARAGANTVSELEKFALPAIFIPLPHAHRDEQTLNARAYAQTQTAMVIPQAELTPVRLTEAVDQLLSKPMERSSRPSLPVADPAAAQLYLLIKKISNSP